MGESGLVHDDNNDLSDGFQPLIERLTAPPPHQAAGGSGQQRLSRVHLGNNSHGGDLAVPAGQTWVIDGDVKIEDGAMLKIEDSATLQVNGHQATGGSGGQGHHQRLSQVRSRKKETPDVLGALLLRPDPIGVEQQRLQAELDGVASAWRSASLNDLQAVFATALLSNSEPVLLLHLVNELQSAADQVAQAAGNAAAGEFETKALQRMVSTAAAAAKEIDQMASVSGTALHMVEKMQATAAEIARMAIVPALGTALESRVSWAEGISKSVAIPMVESTLMQVAEMLHRQDQSMAAQLTRAVQPLIAQTNDMQAALRVVDQYRQWAGATEVATAGVLLRLRPKPEPPAERVQVVHLAPGDVLEALTLMLQNGDVAPGDVAACLYSFSTEQRQAGLYPPDWPVIEIVVTLYKELGANYPNQEAFVRWLIGSAKGRALGLGSFSLRTFQRYLETWEQYTTERVRPGKGRRKRGAQL